MIAKLNGILDRRDDGAVVIDVGGVGYLVFVSARAADRLGGWRRRRFADRDTCPRGSAFVRLRRSGRTGLFPAAANRPGSAPKPTPCRPTADSVLTAIAAQDKSS